MIKAMQRIRWLLGLIAAISFVIVSLGWFTKRIILEKVTEQAQFYGYDQAGFEDISLTSRGIVLKNIYLKHSKEDRKILADHVCFHINLKSLLRRKVENAEVKGLRIFNHVNDLKNLAFTLQNEHSKEDSIFSSLSLEGIAHLLIEKDDFLTLFNLSFENHSFKKQLTGNFKVVSNHFNSRINVYGEKNGEDLKFDLYVYDLKGKLYNLNYFINQAEISFYPLEYQSTLAQSFGAKVALIEVGIGENHQQNNYIPLNMTLSPIFTIGEGIFHIEGSGNLNIADNPLEINLDTRDEILKVEIRSQVMPDNKINSITGKLTDQKLQKFSGTLRSYGSVNVPCKVAGIDKSNVLASLGAKLWEIMDSGSKEGSLTTELTDFSFSYENLYYSGLRGKVNFSLFPFESRGVQKISFKEFTISNHLKFEDGECEFLYKDKLRPNLFKAAYNEGFFKLHSFQQNLDGHESFYFELQNVDLSKTISLFDLEKVQALGRVSGRGQILITPKKGYEIINAKFFSEGKSGQIKIENTELKTADKSLDREKPEDNFLNILGDLNYTNLTMELIPEGSDLIAKFDVMGYNPNIHNGHPFHFKFQTHGDLKEILPDYVKDLKMPEFSSIFKVIVN